MCIHLKENVKIWKAKTDKNVRKKEFTIIVGDFNMFNRNGQILEAEKSVRT